MDWPGQGGQGEWGLQRQTGPPGAHLVGVYPLEKGWGVLRLEKGPHSSHTYVAQVEAGHPAPVLTGTQQIHNGWSDRRYQLRQGVPLRQRVLTSQAVRGVHPGEVHPVPGLCFWGAEPPHHLRPPRPCQATVLADGV